MASARRRQRWHNQQSTKSICGNGVGNGDDDSDNDGDKNKGDGGGGGSLAAARRRRRRKCGGGGGKSVTTPPGEGFGRHDGSADIVTRELGDKSGRKGAAGLK